MKRIIDGWGKEEKGNKTNDVRKTETANKREECKQKNREDREECKK